MSTDEAVNPKFEKETPLIRIKRQATAFIQEYDQKHDPSAEHDHARQFAGACTTLIASIEHYEKALKIVSDDLFLERARKVFPGISLADALKEAEDRESEFTAGLHLLYPTPFLDIVRNEMYKTRNKNENKKTRKPSLKRTRLPDGQPAGYVEIIIKGANRIGKSIMAQLIARALEPVYKNITVSDGVEHSKSSMVNLPYPKFVKSLTDLYDGEPYPRVLGINIMTKTVEGEISGWHQVETDKNAKMKNGVIYSPAATFVSSIGGGGRAQIIRSSGFYKVAYRVPGDKYEFSENIIPEFLDVMAKLEKERKKV